MQPDYNQSVTLLFVQQPQIIAGMLGPLTSVLQPDLAGHLYKPTLIGHCDKSVPYILINHYNSSSYKIKYGN